MGDTRTVRLRGLRVPDGSASQPLHRPGRVGTRRWRTCSARLNRRPGLPGGWNLRGFMATL
jgi:hypothetical protein